MLSCKHILLSKTTSETSNKKLWRNAKYSIFTMPFKEVSLFSQKFALLKNLYYLCHDNQSINPHGRLLRGKLLRLIGGMVLQKAFPRRYDFFTFLGDTSTEDFLSTKGQFLFLCLKLFWQKNISTQVIYRSILFFCSYV